MSLRLSHFGVEQDVHQREIIPHVCEYFASNSWEYEADGLSLTSCQNSLNKNGENILGYVYGCTEFIDELLERTIRQTLQPMGKEL